MNDAIQGTVYGKNVTLTSDPGLEEGQRVEVILRPVASEKRPACSAAGMLADIPGLDESLEEIGQTRKMARYRTDSP